jgi:diketogulonate reductase-like aldo/keto reductase
VSAKAEGLCRAIGVSNYEVRHLDEMVVYAREMPATNQIECHPAFRQDALRARCAQLGCVVQAYSPLGTGELLEDRHVRAAARLCNCTTAQVLLAWGLARGCVVLPRSADEGRIEENAKAETVVLTEEAEGELARVAPRKFCWDPSGVA